MRIFVKVKPHAKEEKVLKIDENHFTVWVKEPPQEGKANQKTLKVLATYFKVSSSNLKIVSGQTSRNKCIEIYK